jgi:hypothetical protein
MSDDKSNTKLTEFRNWLIARLEARQDSPAMWYRFVKLREALEEALGQASAEGQRHDRAPLPIQKAAAAIGRPARRCRASIDFEKGELFGFRRR